ncbi:MAG: EamA family transporter [SAR86 cluster bacterium]|uniref:EamA family transporter n=1 Tax=SAR86 cluster bacterium TaxID=2030880 RepID=A0A2A5AS01_9GAMM|nr:MAG: EamA family transporter [SAR86 cluster bacterium]
MSPLIFSAVLFAALLHACWNALIKVSGDRLVVMAVTTSISSILVIPALIYLPLPAVESWPYLAASAFVHTFYMLLLVKAYGFGDFAQVYPLSRGSAPMLTAILSFFILSEAMSAVEIAGMLLIVLGIFGLVLERSAGVLQLSRPALIYSLLTGLCITGYSLVDGIGARLSGNSTSFTLWMFFLDGFMVPIVAYRRRPRKILINTLKSVWKSGLVVSLLSMVGYAIIVWAFSQARIAPVAVLRETSVLFAMLISVFLIKEAFSLLRVGIVLLILGGIILLGI